MKTVATALLHNVQTHNRTDKNNWRPRGKNLNEKNMFWGENMPASSAKQWLIVYTANSVPPCRVHLDSNRNISELLRSDVVLQKRRKGVRPMRKCFPKN